MPTERRYCRRCDRVTEHRILYGDGLRACLCRECLARWAQSEQVVSAHRQEGMAMQAKQIPTEPRIHYSQIRCDACHQVQFYGGRMHVHCIGCHSPLDLEKLRTVYRR